MIAARKKALLIGINYVACSDNNVHLNGCNNDCDLVKNTLLEKGYCEDNISVVKDSENLSKTSKEGILDELYGLMISSWRENLEEIIIHFSGHGSMLDSVNTIIPWDFKTAGVIPDYKIHQILRQANPSTKIISIFDCCHSGEIANLPFKYFKTSETEKGVFASEETQYHSLTRNSEIESRVITISACKNKQTAAGSFNLRNECEYSGVLSTYLCQVSRENKYKELTLSDLLEHIQSCVKTRGFQQDTVVCSNEKLQADFPVF